MAKPAFKYVTRINGIKLPFPMTLPELLLCNVWFLIALIAAIQLPAALAHWFGIGSLPLQPLGFFAVLMIVASPVFLWLHTMRRNGKARARREEIKKPTVDKD